MDTSDQGAAAPTSATRTVQRALALLEAVASAGGAGACLSDLARAVGLSASTTSRLLGTLRLQGYLARTETGDYRVGPRLRQIAVSTIREEPLYELAGPHLEALARETGETASLAIALDEDSALYLRQVASSRTVRAASWTGRTVPRRDTALGAALDAHLNSNGFAVVRGAVEDDVTSIAVPVYGEDGTVVGALSVLAPRYRTPASKERAHAHALRRHASELSATVGGIGSTPPQRARAGRR